MSLFVFAISGCGGSSHRPPIGNGTGNEVVYSTEESSRNALLITEGSPTYENIIVYKTGDATGDNYDKIGDNAAILAKNGATPMISNAKISTDAIGANAVFAYGGGTTDGTRIIIQSSDIYTYSSHSGGIMVTGGGKIDATNLNITTYGQSSAAIRSDQGGGEIVVDKGTYTTNGQGSPAIYSTANVTVKEADLVANSSQGVVIEGENSVTLDHVNVTADHKTLNGNDSTHQAVLIYQSDSGDASKGEGKFSMTGGTITNTTGDIFCVTNTEAEINLTDVGIVNNDSAGIFLRAEAQKWGSSGRNGGNVTLNADNQNISGNIVIDDLSSLTMNLTNSSFDGAINPSEKGGTVNIILDSDSVWTLTGNSNITTLSGDGTINYSVYTLNVDGYEFNSVIPYDPNGVFSKDITVDVVTPGSHAIAQTSGTFYIDNPIITKIGDVSESDETSIQGANAAVLSSGDANITIKGSNTDISTNATCGDALFANGGSIHISGSGAKIKTLKDYSSALAASNGGTITADGLTITTSGLSSPAARIINGGTIEVSNTSMKVNNSNAVLISGDSATFSIKGGSIVDNGGDTFRVINSQCNINISGGAAFTNTDGKLLQLSDSNSKQVKFTIEEGQTVQGNIITDSSANLEITLKGNAKFIGSVNPDTYSGVVSVVLMDGAKWTLTDNSHITSTNDLKLIDQAGFTLSRLR